MSTSPLLAFDTLEKSQRARSPSTASTLPRTSQSGRSWYKKKLNSSRTLKRFLRQDNSDRDTSSVGTRSSRRSNIPTKSRWGIGKEKVGYSLSSKQKKKKQKAKRRLSELTFTLLVPGNEDKNVIPLPRMSNRALCEESNDILDTTSEVDDTKYEELSKSRGNSGCEALVPDLPRNRIFYSSDQSLPIVVEREDKFDIKTPIQEGLPSKKVSVDKIKMEI